MQFESHPSHCVLHVMHVFNTIYRMCPVVEADHAGFSPSDKHRRWRGHALERWGEEVVKLVAVADAGHESWARLGWGYYGTEPFRPVAEWQGVVLSDPASGLGIVKLELGGQELGGTSHTTHTYIHDIPVHTCTVHYLYACIHGLLAW